MNILNETHKLAEAIYREMINEAIKSDEMRKIIGSYIRCVAHGEHLCHHKECLMISDEILKALLENGVNFAGGSYEFLKKLLIQGSITFFKDVFKEALRLQEEKAKS